MRARRARPVLPVHASSGTARAIDYFRESVGTPFAVASFRAVTAGLLERETALARIREAAYVFTGPGSRLLAAGIEVHDAPGGSSWELRRSP